MKSRTLEEAIIGATKYFDKEDRAGAVFGLILGWLYVDIEGGDACALRIEKAIVEKMPHLARGYQP